MLKMFESGDLVLYVGPLAFLGGLVGRVDVSYFAMNEKAWKYKIKFPGQDRPSWFDQTVLESHQETPREQRPATPPAELSVAEAKRVAAEAQEALQRALQAQAEREEAQRLADEEQARKAAVLERLHYEQSLAAATSALLQDIEALTKYPGEVPRHPAKTLGDFRHELQPLAETYGYAIVPVGDGTRATISLI